MKTKFLYLVLLGILISFISCGNDKSNLPSGPARKVLSPDLFSQLSSKYGQINDFEFGYAIVQKDKFGLIDYEGNEVLACIYDTIYSNNSDIILSYCSRKVYVSKCRRHDQSPTKESKN